MNHTSNHEESYLQRYFEVTHTPKQACNISNHGRGEETTCSEKCSRPVSRTCALRRSRVSTAQYFIIVVLFLISSVNGFPRTPSDDESVSSSSSNSTRVHQTYEDQICYSLKNVNKFFVELALGAIAAIIAQTLTAPIERLKLYLQTEPVEERGKGYKRALSGLLQKEALEDNDIPKQHSILQLWRGNSAALVKAVPQKGLELAINDFIGDQYKEQLMQAVIMLKLVGNIMISGITGVIVTIGLYPLDVVRTRLANDVNKKARNTMASEKKQSAENSSIVKTETEITELSQLDDDCFSASSVDTAIINDNPQHGLTISIVRIDQSTKSTEEKPVSVLKAHYKGGVWSTMRQIVHDENVYALYQGLKISCGGAFIYVGLKLGLLAFFEESFREKTASNSYFVYAILSWVCSVVAGFISYPIETIRRRMMVRSYDSWYDCYQEIINERGHYLAFFNGCLANFMLSVTSMIILTLYKMMKTELFNACQL